MHGIYLMLPIHSEEILKGTGEFQLAVPQQWQMSIVSLAVFFN